jgi:hypothetical protein
VGSPHLTVKPESHLPEAGLLPLIACLLSIAVLGFMVFGPFLVTFAVAASTALLLAPVQARVSRAVEGGRPPPPPPWSWSAPPSPVPILLTARCRGRRPPPC